MFCLILIFQCYARLILQELESLKTQPEESTLPRQHCTNHNAQTKYGYLHVPNGAISFIYYQGRGQHNIVYINGGPGLSSQISNFLEIGPHFGQWNNFSNLLFLDLPAGTGYGRTNTTSNLSYEDVAIDYEIAMQNFNKLCKLTYDNVILFSTDFGARFALAIANRSKTIKCVGLLDPFLDTLNIVTEIPNFAFHMGVIDYQELIYFEKAIIKLSDDIYNGNYQHENAKFLKQLYYMTGNVSLYNVLEQKLYSEDEDKLEQILNDPESLYYIPFETEFLARSQNVFDQFKYNFFEPFDNKIIQHLLSNKNILVYQSQYDMLIPPSGTMKWLISIQYELDDFFYQNQLIKLMKDDKLIGLQKRGGYLEYLFVLNTGQVMHRDNCNNSMILIQQYLESII
ncbi:unnamed protein product [Paramecium primaurelia]|uniref:AB hydrolase-1 domain-containing protein n=1 Tax=Paramecium primaurelia TaxID=5886 RepID=A0A8S1PBY6_PARPR|nr:unnamed protein product [Paramecium primaurelia]